jgi:hypothetical protein
LIWTGCFWVNLNVSPADLVVAAEVLQHLEFALNCRRPF